MTGSTLLCVQLRPSSAVGAGMIENSVKSIICGESVTIRPLLATDTALDAEFVRHLSVEARRFRFFGSVKELSAAELKLLCEVDGRQSMAYVATTQANGHETAIGVSRYALSLKDGAREMALTIADEWQERGVAELLTAQLIEYAKCHGVKLLYSVELADNYAMQQLTKKLGMSAERDPDDANQIIYSLTL
jgi:GNAT superfamily N-acetyltransferase